MKTTNHKTNPEVGKEMSANFDVPEDIFYYVAKIIGHVKFKHQILGVIEDRPYIKIKINYNSKLDFDNKAIENIASLIRDYETIRYDGLEVHYL